mmetsp:Transcript_11638/g.18008  ORF Transcript_11638/g.18008 Transcript_11638/m.18008 type:complete len:85 (+) Transcript_11638:592-846(+)
MPILQNLLFIERQSEQHFYLTYPSIKKRRREKGRDSDLRGKHFGTIILPSFADQKAFHDDLSFPSLSRPSAEDHATIQQVATFI